MPASPVLEAGQRPRSNANEHTGGFRAKADRRAPVAPLNEPDETAARPAAEIDLSNRDKVREQIAMAPRRVPDAAPDSVHSAVLAATAYVLALYDAAWGKVTDLTGATPESAHNLVGASITLGLSVIMIILMAIVAGYFVQEAPSDGAFQNSINQVESVGGTAFILLAVALLAVPVVAIVGYFVNSGLGGFISGGTMRR